MGVDIIIVQLRVARNDRVYIVATAKGGQGGAAVA